MDSTATEFIDIFMANPDQKTILIEETYQDIKQICDEFQKESGATNLEIKNLLREIINEWEKKKEEEKSF